MDNTIAGEPIVTLKHSTGTMFKEFEILQSNGFPTEKKSWSFVYKVQKENDGETVSLRRLNVSKWRLIRRIELYILRKLFTQPKN